jgi:hypothetical protein
MIFFSQNKPPPIFSEGVILNLSGYYGVFFARGFAGVFAVAGFFAKVCFFFAGAAAGTGAGSGTYGIGVISGCGTGSILIGTGQPGCPGWCVVELGGSTLYGADTVGVVTASKG